MFPASERGRAHILTSKKARVGVHDDFNERKTYKMHNSERNLLEVPSMDRREIIL